MNSGLSKFLIFATGAAIGSVVTWKLVETRYARIANEEIESVREYYANKDKEKLTDEAYGEDDEESDTEENEETIEMKDYRKIIAAAGYSDKVEEDKNMVNEKPYVISPEDADDRDDYELEQLDYYEGDETLVDSFGDVVEDIDGTVGADFASHFGDYEQDTVYVANDETKTVYEICRDYRSYAEVY